MITLDPKKESIPKIHHTLLGGIAPRPIAFASTVDAKGNPNLSPFSFFNAFGANPATLIFSPARRGRDNTTKHTLDNLKEVPEVVINAVSYSMVQQASLASTEYPRGVNEFIKAGFTAIPSEKIKPFRVKESPIQFECKVQQIIETGPNGGAGNLVICEVLLIHLDEMILDANQMIDPDKIDLVGRMGGDFYCRASGKALFKVEKPLQRLGLGIDKLPDKIKFSHLLSGNDLGRLGNIEAFPSDSDIESYRNSHPELNTADGVITFAKKLLDNNQAEEALMALMAFL